MPKMSPGLRLAFILDHVSRKCPIIQDERELERNARNVARAYRAWRNMTRPPEAPMTHDRCTIRRVRTTHEPRGSVRDRVIVTEACGRPLHTPDEYETAVCRTCQRGWEIVGDRFASDHERVKAVAAGAFNDSNEYRDPTPEPCPTS